MSRINYLTYTLCWSIILINALLKAKSYFIDRIIKKLIMFTTVSLQTVIQK